MEDANGKRKILFEHARIENENTFISPDLVNAFPRKIFCLLSAHEVIPEKWIIGKLKKRGVSV